MVKRSKQKFLSEGLDAFLKMSSSFSCENRESMYVAGFLRKQRLKRFSMMDKTKVVSSFRYTCSFLRSLYSLEDPRSLRRLSLQRHLHCDRLKLREALRKEISVVLDDDFLDYLCVRELTYTYRQSLCSFSSTLKEALSLKSSVKIVRRECLDWKGHSRYSMSGSYSAFVHIGYFDKQLKTLYRGIPVPVASFKEDSYKNSYDVYNYMNGSKSSSCFYALFIADLVSVQK